MPSYNATLYNDFQILHNFAPFDDNLGIHIILDYVFEYGFESTLKEQSKMDNEQ